jgi:hypothetical protein
LGALSQHAREHTYMLKSLRASGVCARAGGTGASMSDARKHTPGSNTVAPKTQRGQPVAKTETGRPDRAHLSRSLCVRTRTAGLFYTDATLRTSLASKGYNTTRRRAHAQTPDARTHGLPSASPDFFLAALVPVRGLRPSQPSHRSARSMQLQHRRSLPLLLGGEGGRGSSRIARNVRDSEVALGSC